MMVIFHVPNPWDVLNFVRMWDNVIKRNYDDVLVVRESLKLIISLTDMSDQIWNDISFLS